MRRPRPSSLLDPDNAPLLAGWHSGCRNGAPRCQPICRHGGRGQYGIVALDVRRRRQAQRVAPWPRRSAPPLPAVPTVAPRRLTPRRATWLVLRPSAGSADHDHPQLAPLTPPAPELTEAVALAPDGAGWARQRPPAQLEPWLVRAATSALPPFQRFAKGLRADRAAVPRPWSQGPIAGQINRLKMLNRHRYGRARLDRLARRVLLAA
jgi:transposase